MGATQHLSKLRTGVYGDERRGGTKKLGWMVDLGLGSDPNKEGFADFVVCKPGKNSYFSSTADYPVHVVAKDFDGDGIKLN